MSGFHHPLVEAVMDADVFPEGRGKELPPRPLEDDPPEYLRFCRAFSMCLHPAVAAVMAVDDYY